MKIAFTSVLAAGMTSFVLGAGLAGPAHAKCVVPHPILGIDTYVEDKYCPPKATKKAVRKKIRKRTRQTAMVKKMSASSPARGNDIRELQKRLAAMGYNPGAVDGIDGPATRKAASEFNISAGLPADASTVDTLSALKRISGK